MKLTRNFTRAHIAELRSLLNLLEATLDKPGGDPLRLQPGDVAKLHPQAEKPLGGTLFRVTQAGEHEVRGYYLRAHRGACREAWRTLPRPLVHRIGKMPFAESEFGTRGL